MMAKRILDGMSPGIRRWWLRREIASHEEEVERAHRNFEEGKIWTAQKLVERQDAERKYKEFRELNGLD